MMKPLFLRVCLGLGHVMLNVKATLLNDPAECATKFLIFGLLIPLEECGSSRLEMLWHFDMRQRIMNAKCAFLLAVIYILP